MKIRNRLIILWLFIILPILSAILFRKSFDLGLYGDDWQHLYNLWRDFFVYHSKSFWDIRSYLNPYWPEYLYLGIIEHFWGYHPPAYFIASFLSRLFANITLYFFVYQLTKNKLAAFIATLVFLISVAGLQTTDWVFNMNTYAGLGLLAMASTIYLKLRSLTTFKSWYYPIFIVTFTLALAIVPTRMHGAAPFIVLMEVFLTYFVDKQKIKFDKYLLTRVVLAIFIFFILIHFKSFGESSYTSERFNDSQKLIQNLVENGYSSWWLYFFGVIGHLVLPDNINLLSLAGSVQNITPIKNVLTAILIFESLFSTFFLVISTYVITKSKKTLYMPVIFNLVWFIFLNWISKIDNRTSTEIYFAISLGGQYLFWAIWFYILGRKKYHQTASALIISILWIVSLTMIYWLFTPYYVIETTGRYMTMGAAGMAIFLGSLSTIILKEAIAASSNKVNINSRFIGSISLGVTLIFLLVFFVKNLSTGQNYLNILHNTRNKDLTERSWNKLLKEVPKLDPNGPSIFYFTTDNPLSLEGVFIFGFFMRAGMTYRIPDQDLTPLPTINYKELLAYVKDGSPLQKIHGRKANAVPLSRIFAFDFRNGELIPITDHIRQKLAEDLNLNN